MGRSNVNYSKSVGATMWLTHCVQKSPQLHSYLVLITSLLHSYRSGNVPCIEVWTQMQNPGLGNVIKCHLFFQITLITCNINTELEIKNSNARYSLTLEFKSFSNHFFLIQLYCPDRENGEKPESFSKIPSKFPRTSHLHVQFCLRKS